MPQEELSGVVVPVITPVDDQDRVDEPAFRQVIRRLIAAGVHVLFIGGSAGEGPLLTTREWTRMMEIAFDEAHGVLPLLGGVMETSTARVIEKISILARIGYHHYVVTPTFYFSLKTPDEHFRLFSACKDHDGGMNLIPYNIPSVAHSEIPIETLCDLARRGWVRYCKESSGNLDYFRRLVSEGRDSGLQAFMGDELGILEGLRAGACGMVPVCANFAPEPFLDAYRAALNHDDTALREAYERILVVRTVPLTGAFWVSGIKYALSWMGMGSGRPVSPMEPLNREQQEKVAAFIHNYSLAVTGTKP